MSPKSVAQRQKEYRERLKNENPKKLKEIMKKNTDRAREHYRKKKVQNLTEDRTKMKVMKIKEPNTTFERETQEEQQDSMKQPVTSKSDTNLIRNLQRRLDNKLKKQNKEVQDKVQRIWRGFKSLQKRCNRQQKKIETLESTCDSLLIELHTLKTKIDETVLLNDISTVTPNEYTPLKRTEEFIKENLNNIETPQKTVIKKTLLEHNVLKESLKEKFSTSSNTNKNTLKEIIDNDLVRKYKLKSSLTQSLGLKSNFKKYRNMKHRKYETIEKIVKFYIRDNVSRASAGKKEFKTVNRKKIQKRYLLDKLSILHNKYVSEVGPISFSTFKKYRPCYVVPPSVKDLESCACAKHSNMQFIASKLKSLGLLESGNLNDIISSFVCDKNVKTCMYGDCPVCADKVIQGNENEDMTKKVTWNLWALVTHEYGEPGNVKKTKKMTKTVKDGSLQDLIDMFNKDLKPFKKHVYNVHHQYIQYKHCLENLKENEILVHIDFSRIE